MHKVKLYLKWIVYPFIMLMSISLYYTLVAFGLGITLSSFISATLCGLGLITLFEILLPYRKDWTPNSEEIKTDTVFMLLIQIALPKLLTLFAIVYLANIFHNERNESLWPHHQPIWIQMLIMMFAADFFRYWLHRASHEWPFLWRFHAVHHSVEKLYWLNVGRFHPVDKSLQFFLETLPFILLGVSQEVMALYFVVYATKGFFQHSNVDVKLGWFNYIISGPELHRWHHSKEIKESNTNYGNNIILWDIVFGTFFMPESREVNELGLVNGNYPRGFWTQMKSPFRKGLDKSNE
jgi:ornithine lipid hydroxylase